MKCALWALAAAALAVTAWAANPMMLAVQNQMIFAIQGVANFAHYANGAITSTGPFTNENEDASGVPTVTSGVASPAVLNEVESASWNAVTFSNDQYCIIEIAALSSVNNAVGCMVRASGGNQGYYCYVAGPTGASAYYAVLKVVAGSPSFVTGPTTVPNAISIGDFVSCRAIGTQIEMDWFPGVGGSAGVAFYLGTDTSITSGSPGVYVETTSGTLTLAGVGELIVGNVQ